MQSGLVGMICQIGIFMICAQAIVHFRPKASYEKYLKLLVSAMMLMQVFLFVGGIFSKEGQKGLAQRAEWFADSMEESMQKAAENAFFSQEEHALALMEENSEQSYGQVFSEEQLGIRVQIAPITPVQIDTIQ